MPKAVNFSEIMVTRLCHDLASAVGAVNNGIEILEDTTDAALRKKAFQIITENGEEAARRIHLYRLMYGVVRTEGEIDLHEAQHIVNDYYKNSKLELVWNNLDAGGIVQLTGRAVKLLVNMIYLSSNVLILGGRVMIDISRTAQGKNIVVRVMGDKLKVHENIDAILKNHEQVDINLSNIQVCLTSQIAELLNVKLECSYDDKTFVLAAKFL